MRRFQAGVSYIELLVSLLMTIVIAGGLFSVFKNTYESRDFVVGQGTAETAARTPIDTLADHIRDAQQCHIGSGSNVTDYSVIANGTATSVTYYKSDSSTDTVKYWLSGTDLKRTADGSTTTVLSNVQSLQFNYKKTPASGNYNNLDTNLLDTSNPNAPSAAELPYLSQIAISASVKIDGYVRDMASLVRLRNSPRKIHL